MLEFGTKLTKMLGNPIKEMREGVDALKYDLMRCGWKIGYLKNVFKVPLSYGKLFVLLRKNRV